LGSGETTGALDRYLAEISRIPILSAAEERDLARRFRQQGDLRAGHELITSNLRFVVKVAFEYRSYGLRMGDLIQEGNLGLMRAVQKFDPEREIRLISYAVWWIRAYIHGHILRSWSLVKLGTTQAQRKLFFSLARTRRSLERDGGPDGAAAPEEQSIGIARLLGVKPLEVQEMTQRLNGRDLSLDAPLGEAGGSSHLASMAGSEPGQEEALAEHQDQVARSAEVRRALDRLDPRERFILERRVMADAPLTLKQVGRHFGFSRERARQLELRAREKMRVELAGLAPDQARGGADALG
jgi:RNA polymerase sigma-32 factor